MSNRTRNVLLLVTSMADNRAELHCSGGARGSMLLQKLFFGCCWFFFLNKKNDDSPTTVRFPSCDPG